jgi:S1-C subfamily serine protease
VYNISFPQAFGWAYSEGYVMSNPVHWSGIYKDHAKRLFKTEMIQFSLSITGGSSGSPVFNSEGFVVGMVNIALNDCDIVAGLNLKSLKAGLAEFANAE